MIGVIAHVSYFHLWAKDNPEKAGKLVSMAACQYTNARIIRRVEDAMGHEFEEFIEYGPRVLGLTVEDRKRILIYLRPTKKDE